MNTKATKQGGPAFKTLVGRLAHASRARARALGIFFLPNFAQSIVYNILIPLSLQVKMIYSTPKYDANADVMCLILAVYSFLFLDVICQCFF